MTQLELWPASSVHCRLAELERCSAAGYCRRCTCELYGLRLDGRPVQLAVWLAVVTWNHRRWCLLAGAAGPRGGQHRRV